MATQRQIAANRQNAKLGGPKTAAGLDAVRHNALKHGLYSACVVLPHESQSHFDEILESFARDLQPANSLEWAALEELTRCYWRLMRIRRAERELFDSSIAAVIDRHEFEENSCSTSGDEALAIVLSSGGFAIAPGFQRQLALTERAYNTALRNWQLLRRPSGSFRPKPAAERPLAEPDQPAATDTPVGTSPEIGTVPANSTPRAAAPRATPAAHAIHIAPMPEYDPGLTPPPRLR